MTIIQPPVNFPFVYLGFESLQTFEDKIPIRAG